MVSNVRGFGHLRGNVGKRYKFFMDALSKFNVNKNGIKRAVYRKTKCKVLRNYV